jgi:hypothetical protein
MFLEVLHYTVEKSELMSEVHDYQVNKKSTVSNLKDMKDRITSLLEADEI